MDFFTVKPLFYNYTLIILFIKRVLRYIFKVLFFNKIKKRLFKTVEIFFIFIKQQFKVNIRIIKTDNKLIIFKTL